LSSKHYFQGTAFEALEKYGIDLVERACQGRMDSVIGRDEAIRRVTRNELRKAMNTPVLIGELGVGKTAIFEGFAQRIIGGVVSAGLADKTILPSIWIR
jgi:ATP-dependent Clp protease ATP-binding subunit ClpB